MGASMQAEQNAHGVHYYAPGPVAKAFLKSDSFVSGIRGPIGSGKSTAAVMKLVRNAQKQAPLRDGWRRRRTVITRNTYSELKTTTIKTWHLWVPPSIGHWRDSGPPMHHIVDEANKFDWEVIFLALDRPDDVRKILSLDVSDAWMNEAREIPKAVLDGLTGRVGRFPRVEDGGCTDPQILMDTNSPDRDHWWYVLAERDGTNERNRVMLEQMVDIEAELRRRGDIRPDQKLFEFFSQPGGEEPDAENLKNLPAGYYLKAKAGKDDEWVKVYVRNEYGFVMDGKPVFPEYRDNVHCKSFELTPRLGLRLGMDFGLTPAATIGQLMPSGQWRVRSEVVTEDMGIPRFGELVKQHLALKYPGFKIEAIHGDPAGDIRGGDERTVFDMLKAVGIEAKKAPGNNDPVLRRESLAAPMRRITDGEPGLLVHPDCSYFRKGLAGGYRLKRLAVVGDARYQDKPEKNIYSHVCEAGEYMTLGGGEGRELVRAPIPQSRQTYAIDDYNILG